jgi:hypothetical protein
MWQSAAASFNRLAEDDLIQSRQSHQNENDVRDRADTKNRINDIPVK